MKDYLKILEQTALSHRAVKNNAKYQDVADAIDAIIACVKVKPTAEQYLEKVAKITELEMALETEICKNKKELKL
jgi:hypothetical protein